MSEGAAKAAKRQRGRPFKPGESGNPAGRRQGTKNRVTLACESLLDGEAERLTRVCIDKALSGDILALRLCLERILPPRRDRHVEFELPKIEKLADLPAASAAIVQAVSESKLTPSEAVAVSAALSAHRMTIAEASLDERLEALEKKVAQSEEFK